MLRSLDMPGADMRLPFRILLAAIGLGATGLVPAAAATVLIEGTIAEPADTSELGELTSFEVRLVDVTDAAAPPRPIAGSKLTPGRDHAWPLPFRIGVDGDALAAGRTYAVEARVSGQRLLFETAEPVPVDPFAEGAVIALEVGPPASAALADVRWAAEEAGPGGLPRPQLTFTRNRVSGRVGCRSLRGRTEFSGSWLTLREVSLDGMGCGAESAAYEEEFAALVSRVRRFAIADGVLVLQSGDGTPLVRLTAK